MNRMTRQTLTREWLYVLGCLPHGAEGRFGNRVHITTSAPRPNASRGSFSQHARAQSARQDDLRARTGQILRSRGVTQRNSAT
jgi:hypothetical protein